MTLEEARRVEAAATPVARALIVLALVAAVTLPVAFYFEGVARNDRARMLRIALSIGVPLLLVGATILAWRLRRTSPEGGRPALLWAGALAIVASAAFDPFVVLTMHGHVPYFATSFAKLVFTRGYSHAFYWIYVGACLALSFALLSVLLSAVLAHVEPLRALAWASRPRGRREFVAAATRGCTETSPLFGLPPRDWRSLKAHPAIIWLAAVTFISACFVRPALSLEWMGLNLPPPAALLILVLGSMLIVRVGWTRCWRRGPPPGVDAAPAESLPPSGAKRRRLESVVNWILLVLIPIVVLAAPTIRDARDVAAMLDDQIQLLEREVVESRDAASRTDEIAADVERLEIAWREAPAARVLPCESDGLALLAEVRALAEPLGVTIEGEAAFMRRRRKDFYDEVPIRVLLPHEDGSAARLEVALARSPRLLRLPQKYSKDSFDLYIVAYEYRCDDFAVRLPDHREMPWGRERLFWPFDRGVVRREREIDRLRAERDEHAEELMLLNQQKRIPLEIDRRQEIADDLMREAATPK